MPFISSQNNEDAEEREIAFRLWVINHYRQIKFAVIAAMIVISAISWGYTIYGFLDYYFITGPKERLAFNELAVELLNPEMLAARRPRELAVEDVKIFSSGDKYDLVVRVANPNPNWYVVFSYKFVGSDKELPGRAGFILPGEEKFLMNLGVAPADKPASPAVVFYDTKWQRIDAHQLPDYKEWGGDHLNFEISNKKFGAIDATGNFNQLDFKIKNATAYSYWNVDTAILLLRGSTLQGVNFINLNKFLSGEERDISLVWKDSDLAPTEIEIAPSVNIFDPSVYMPVK
jgi:hypothetical protein